MNNWRWTKQKRKYSDEVVSSLKREILKKERSLKRLADDFEIPYGTVCCIAQGGIYFDVRPAEGLSVQERDTLTRGGQAPAQQVKNLEEGELR